MPPLPPSITLTGAKSDDIETMHELTRSAFETDIHTQLKELVKGQPVFDESNKTHLHTLLAHPRVEITVARDAEQGDRVVGFVIMSRRNIDVPRPAPSLKLPSLPAPPDLPAHRPLTVADLEVLTNASMAAWEDYLSPAGSPCWVVIGLTVHPADQGRGVGGALLRRALARADEDGVYTWVQTSMGSRGHYAAAGFREVGRLELDLDLFAGGREVPEALRRLTAGSASWGTYVWTYMRAAPAAAAYSSSSSGDDP